jgi:hypothetical protein
MRSRPAVATGARIGQRREIIETSTPYDFAIAASVSPASRRLIASAR